MADSDAGNEEKVAFLRDSLESDDPAIRFNAGLDLVQIGRTEGVPALIEAFENDSPVVRLFNAGRTLAQMGAPAVPFLTEALSSPRPRVRIGAAFTLYKIEPERLPELLPLAMAALSDPDTEVAGDSLFFLGETGQAAREAAPALLERLRAPTALEDPQAWSGDRRTRVAALLVKIGEPAAEIVATLRGALNAGDAPSLRWAAALALGEMGGPAARVAVLDLAARLRDESEVETVRVGAAYSLASLGDPETEAVPALMEALHSRDGWVRVFVAHLLGEMASPLPQEQAEQRNLGWLDRIFIARRAVGRVSDPAAQVVPALAGALTDADFNVRRNAACALAAIGEKAAGAVPALIGALSAEDIGPVAAEALAKIGAAALPALTTALKEGDSLTRRHAGYALCAMDTAEAKAALEAASRTAPVEPFTPAVRHFYVQVPVTMDAERVAAFAALYERTVARGPGSEVAYELPYPKHEFLRYCVEHKGLLAHGTGRTDLDVLKPIRWSTDSGDSGNVSGVYADKDYVRPIYFAVVHRDRVMGLNNGFFDLTGEGQFAENEDQGFDRRWYRLCIGVHSLRRDPWRDAMVYLLPPDTFVFWNEWASRTPVRPVMKLAVTPDDLPLRHEVWGADWREPGQHWVRPDEPFPFLKDVRGTPIRPSGRPPWQANTPG